MFYETVDDFVRRRQPFREAHLAHAQSAQQAGLLVLAGAFNPADGALLIIRHLRRPAMV